MASSCAAFVCLFSELPFCVSLMPIYEGEEEMVHAFRELQWAVLHTLLIVVGVVFI